MEFFCVFLSIHLAACACAAGDINRTARRAPAAHVSGRCKHWQKLGLIQKLDALIFRAGQTRYLTVLETGLSAAHRCLYMPCGRLEPNHVLQLRKSLREGMELEKEAKNRCVDVLQTCCK